MSDATAIGAGATIGFIGLGRMGHPMASRLAGAGYRVRGFDVSEQARTSWARQAPGAAAVDRVTAAGDDAEAVILMLPDSSAVTEVLIQWDLLGSLRPGTIVVDMSSSEPQVTRELAATAASHRVPLVDAPVSGGVRGAERGTLTVMAGGSPGDVARAGELLGVMGSRVMHVGGPGAGHAVKALNNLLSATHLLATSEALAAAIEFGLDPGTVLDAINVSSGRSGSTENKWPNYVLPRTFDSGFSLRLMVKDIRIALGIAETAGTPARLSAAAAGLWSQAAGALPPGADHTEIAHSLAPALAPRHG